MYYTITNAIGTEVTVDDKVFICGQCYTTKTKAPKDVDYLLAFSKAENPVDDLVWRFDGKADIDAELFVEDVDIKDRDVLAWKSERINIQTRIRPSKDSKKALAAEKRNNQFAEVNTKLAAGDITVEEFAEQTRIIIANM